MQGLEADTALNIGNCITIVRLAESVGKYVMALIVRNVSKGKKEVQLVVLEEKE